MHDPDHRRTCAAMPSAHAPTEQPEKHALVDIANPLDIPLGI
jgi:hypothetical protein